MITTRYRSKLIRQHEIGLLFFCVQLTGLLVPIVNYWWPSFPSDLSTEAYYQHLPQDQWAVRVAHYAPWLTYKWNTQKWFPPSSAIGRNPMVFSAPDRAILAKSPPKTDHSDRILRICSVTKRTFNFFCSVWLRRKLPKLH